MELQLGEFSGTIMSYDAEGRRTLAHSKTAPAYLSENGVGYIRSPELKAKGYGSDVIFFQDNQWMLDNKIKVGDSVAFEADCDVSRKGFQVKARDMQELSARQKFAKN